MKPKPISAVFVFSGDITVQFAFTNKGRPGAATVTIGGKSTVFSNTNGDHKARVTDAMQLIKRATAPPPVEAPAPTEPQKRKSRRKTMLGPTIGTSSLQLGRESLVALSAAAQECRPQRVIGGMELIDLRRMGTHAIRDLCKAESVSAAAEVTGLSLPTRSGRKHEPPRRRRRDS